MVPGLLTENSMKYLFHATANFIKLPMTKMRLDYDKEADVLYLHFEEVPSPTHSEMEDNGIIPDYREDTLVGMTILEASRRSSVESGR
jgi:uncharacterized protein YuzE